MLHGLKAGIQHAQKRPVGSHLAAAAQLPPQLMALIDAHIQKAACGSRVAENNKTQRGFVLHLIRVSVLLPRMQQQHVAAAHLIALPVAVQRFDAAGQVQQLKGTLMRFQRHGDRRFLKMHRAKGQYLCNGHEY